MMLDVIKALALNEVRLRLRRTATLVVLMAVVALSWLMIADPSSGTALIVVENARVLYTSTALSVGSASLGCLLFGLGGFYLVRGRMQEDVRSGTGSVIGATPVGNALFLASRWLGGVAYLGAMILAFMATIMVLHAVRGDGPIQPLVYLWNFTLLLLPLMCFTVSCAILFDSWTPLMGKGGDTLYFLVWVAQLMVIVPIANGATGLHAVELFDFSGIGASMLIVSEGLNSSHVALGGGDFSASVAPRTLPEGLWSTGLVAMRLVTMLLALLPMVLAVAVFHRFSPDLVKVSRAGKRRSPVEVINILFKPLARLMLPVFRLAARIGGWPGQVLGEVALTFAAAPFAIVALGASLVAAVVVLPEALGAVVLGAGVYWGVLVCDLSTRDFAADTEIMAGAVPGGAVQRYLRQYACSVAMGFLFTGVALLRWMATDPLRALALAGGVMSMAALASLFGRCSRTARTFLALFLFWVYVAVNARKVPVLDALGFLGVANAQSMLVWGTAGMVALVAGYWWNRRSI